MTQLQRRALVYTPQVLLQGQAFRSWGDGAFDEALKKMTDALRPWTIDFHVAQNDGTVHGSGSYDKTGRHCRPTDPNGKLDIPCHAGYWMRDGKGQLTKAFRHICWDGCMFPNAVMMNPQTWNDILRAMIAVRDAHIFADLYSPEAAVAPAQSVSPPANTHRTSRRWTSEPARGWHRV